MRDVLNGNINILVLWENSLTIRAAIVLTDYGMTEHMWIAVVCQASINRTPLAGWLLNKDSTSHSSGGWESEIGVGRGGSQHRGVLWERAWGLQTADFSWGRAEQRKQAHSWLRACVCSVVSDSLGPHGLQSARLICPWDFPGKNTWLGCHFLLQGIFLAQGLNLCLLHSPALAGGFPTTVPSGKPQMCICLKFCKWLECIAAKGWRNCGSYLSPSSVSAAVGLLAVLPPTVLLPESSASGLLGDGEQLSRAGHPLGETGRQPAGRTPVCAAAVRDPGSPAELRPAEGMNGRSQPACWNALPGQGQRLPRKHTAHWLLLWGQTPAKKWEPQRRSAGVI